MKTPRLLCTGNIYYPTNIHTTTDILKVFNVSCKDLALTYPQRRWLVL